MELPFFGIEMKTDFYSPAATGAFSRFDLAKVNKAEIDVFLDLSCFFDDPIDVGNLISGSSAFSLPQKGRYHSLNNRCHRIRLGMRNRKQMDLL